MTVRALQALALASRMPSSRLQTDATVDISTRWGWHYLLETHDGVPVRVTYRVSLDGETTQHYPSEFELAKDPGEFRPTSSDLGIRE